MAEQARAIATDARVSEALEAAASSPRDHWPDAVRQVWTDRRNPIAPRCRAGWPMKRYAVTVDGAPLPSGVYDQTITVRCKDRGNVNFVAHRHH